MTLFESDGSRLETELKDRCTVIERMDIPLDIIYRTRRHILYLELKDIHVIQRGKYAACNVGCKISLRHNETGKALPGCVLMGHELYAMPKETVESPIYYHNNDPVINQMYQVLVPSDLLELEKCHVYLSGKFSFLL